MIDGGVFWMIAIYHFMFKLLSYMEYLLFNFHRKLKELKWEILINGVVVGYGFISILTPCQI